MTAKQKTGQLIHTGRGWSARFGRTGKLIPLHTNNRVEAEVRLARLRTDPAVVKQHAETFQEATVRIVGALERDGMVTAGERLSRLQRYAWPILGTIPVTDIRSGQISDVLNSAARAGLSACTLSHLRVDIAVVFRELVRDEILPSNPATHDRVRTPKVKRDKRRRALLTDLEFEQVVLAPTTPTKLATMCVCSRVFGGLRTSDLHAWTWEDVDTQNWEFAAAPRPKTEHRAGSSDRPREILSLPELVVRFLHRWWLEMGAPTTGAVFPSGPKKRSYARELRAALLAAGVTRHELHHPTTKTKPVDFHSFRRAFVTAVATSGTNAQTAMRLAGHRSMQTHMRYNLPTVLEIPDAAVPTFGAGLDDFDSALESFDPTASATQIALSIHKTERPHGVTIPGFRRERPTSDPAQNTTPCQAETKKPRNAAILGLFGTGPE